MVWFKKSEEQKREDFEENLEKEKQVIMENTIYNAFAKIIIFPGNIKEFEDFVGYECVVIDTDSQDKGIVYINNGTTKPLSRYVSTFRKKMFDKDLVGIIHAVPISYYRLGDDAAMYGLPVGKKIKN